MNYFDTCLPLDTSPEPFDPSPNPEALAIEHQTHQRLRALFFHTLPDLDARVMVALYLDDGAARDVAQCFMLTEKQVDYYRWKSLKVLRKSAEIRALLLPTATR